MRIGVNARLLLPGTLEGIGRFIFETTKAMALANPDDTFILFFDRTFDPAYLALPNMIGVKVYCPTRHPLLMWGWYEILLPLALKKHKIDVFYSGDNFLSLRSKVPTALVVHDLAYLAYPQGTHKSFARYYKRYTPLFLQRADALIAVSYAVKKDIFTYFPNSKEVNIVYNALPDRTTKPLESRYDFDYPYFIAVGAIHPRKNTQNVIRAFLLYKAESKDITTKLVLVGRLAWGNDDIKELLQHPDIVHLTNVPDHQLYALIDNAIGMIYASLFEGFGIPILEAFHCKTPVITSNISSMPEVAGDAAILIDPYSVEDISNAIKKVAQDQNSAKAMINKGALRLQDFTWTESGARVMQILRHLT